ncbi:MAG: hypothetical protein DMG54_20045 [Acidobacteria bacterium]|nr:MAG: hypothetical protein DMG54_20045 [Acidobacteriota bacterium]
MPIEEVRTASATSARAENRRRNRRVPVSLDVRVRPADFGDGDFEEFRTTQNVSRGALYFLTSLHRYHKGMRLWVAPAHGPSTGSDNWKDHGQVVRVDGRPDGQYGVAVVLSAPRHLATCGDLAQPPGKKNAEARERRDAHRHAFVAPAVVVDAQTGARISARTSDLSLGGCYIDTLNPFPLGTTLRLRIHRNDEIFDAPASTASSHTGSGMGLLFGEMTPEQRSMLAGWLDECVAPSRSSPTAPLQAEKTDQRDHLLAVKLIHSLVQKGVLSQSEAAALLEDSQA